MDVYNELDPCGDPRLAAEKLQGFSLKYSNRNTDLQSLYCRKYKLVSGNTCLAFYRIYYKGNTRFSHSQASAYDL